MATGDGFKSQFILIQAVFISFFRIAALDVESTLSFPHGNMQGRIAILNCVWATSGNESVSALNILINDTVYFTCNVYNINPHLCSKNNSTLPERFTTTVNDEGNISMSIDNLECSDESTYTCQVVLSQATGVKQADAFLRLKIPPSTPTLTIDQTEVIENSNINVSCTATLGYPNAGQIVWKTYQNGIPFTPSTSDIITSSTNVVQSGDDRCTVRKQSSVLLKSSRNNPNISLACFVTNQDFQPIAPDDCTNSTTQWCNLTRTVSILLASVSTMIPLTTKTTNRTITSAITKPSTETQPNGLNTETSVDDTDKTTTQSPDSEPTVMTTTSESYTEIATDRGSTEEDHNETTTQIPEIKPTEVTTTSESYTEIATDGGSIEEDHNETTTQTPDSEATKVTTTSELYTEKATDGSSTEEVDNETTTQSPDSEETEVTTTSELYTEKATDGSSTEEVDTTTQSTDRQPTKVTTISETSSYFPTETATGGNSTDKYHSATKTSTSTSLVVIFSTILVLVIIIVTFIILRSKGIVLLERTMNRHRRIDFEHEMDNIPETNGIAPLGTKIDRQRLINSAHEMDNTPVTHSAAAHGKDKKFVKTSAYQHDNDNESINKKSASLNVKINKPVKKLASQHGNDNVEKLNDQNSYESKHAKFLASEYKSQDKISFNSNVHPMTRSLSSTVINTSDESDS